MLPIDGCDFCNVVMYEYITLLHVCTHVEADGAGSQRGVLTAYNSARLNMVGGDECVMQQILQLIQLHRVLDTKQTITSRVSIIVFIHTDQ